MWNGCNLPLIKQKFVTKIVVFSSANESIHSWDIQMSGWIVNHEGENGKGNVLMPTKGIIMAVEVVHISK